MTVIELTVIWLTVSLALELTVISVIRSRCGTSPWRMTRCALELELTVIEG